MLMNISSQLKKVIEEFELEKIYETDDLDSVMITNTDVNRPGLQMVGFFDYFDPSRIQVLVWSRIRISPDCLLRFVTIVLKDFLKNKYQPSF